MDETSSRARVTATFVALAAAVVAALTLIDNPLYARAVVAASVFLVLALSEAVPPFVPTLALLVATPILLGSLSPQFQFANVLHWAADPVLALFAGGFALGVAGHRHAIDTAIADFVLRVSRGEKRRLLAFALAATAVTSMWMSNIAAAAMMLAALRPIVGAPGLDARFRRALLLAVAVGANLGGMATPIGTGPNAIAIAAAEQHHRIGFVNWMAFGVPLVAGMLVLAFALLALRYRVHGGFEVAPPSRVHMSRKGKGVVVVFLLAVTAWLTEPLHGMPAPLVALAAAAVLFGTGLLHQDDLGELDWSTLGLIAGGLCVGKLLEQSGLVRELVSGIDWSVYPKMVWLGALVLASAVLSALMSNTATAALLVPMGMALDPSPATAVLIAIGASFGMPFVISTPPNAMAYGEGGLRAADLLWVGLPLMLLGCALVTLTGTPVLALLGVP